MIAGPYRSGSTDPEVHARNLRIMNEAALQVWKRGHMPLIGVNMALPVVQVAGEAAYESIMMPISLELADRCDAILRLPGESTGADQELEVFLKKGLPVYRSPEEIPEASA